MQNIIIDTDPGIDDAFALTYALNSDFLNILGITTVSGNNGIDRVTENALKLVDFFKSDVKVYKGSSKPLKKKALRPLVHGDDGLGGQGKSLELRSEAEDEEAVDFILKMAKNHSNITLVSLGPMTNIARAIIKDRKTMENIQEIVSMGGAISKGNISEFAEFNYYADPDAAKLVYDSSIPITMVGLNVTEKAYFTEEEFLKIRDMGVTGRILYDMQKKLRGDKKVIHDLLAMSIVRNKNIGTYKNIGINIVTEGPRRGESFIDKDSQKINMLEDVDIELYKEDFFRIIQSIER